MNRILILAITLSVAFCLLDTEIKQGSLIPEEFQDILQTSYLGRAILGLTQLQGTLSTFNYSSLFQALDELLSSIQVRREEENTNFSSDKEQYQSDQSFYSQQITQYTNEQAQHKIDLDTLANERKSYENALARKRSELEHSSNLKNQLESTMQKNQATFNSQIIEYNDAISVIDQAIELLSSVRDDKSSLIQLSETSFTQTKDQIESKLSALKDRRIFFKPILSVLSQILSSGFADQQLLTQVIKLLNQLRKSLLQNKQELVNNRQNVLQVNQKLMNGYTSKINVIKNRIIPQFQEELQQVLGKIRNNNQIFNKLANIETKKILLTDAINNLSLAQEDSENNENRWLQRQHLNKQLQDQYTKELNIISQAFDALERGNIRRQQ